MGHENEDEDADFTKAKAVGLAKNKNKRKGSKKPRRSAPVPPPPPTAEETGGGNSPQPHPQKDNDNKDKVLCKHCCLYYPKNKIGSHEPNCHMKGKVHTVGASSTPAPGSSKSPSGPPPPTLSKFPPPKKRKSVKKSPTQSHGQGQSHGGLTRKVSLVDPHTTEIRNDWRGDHEKTQQQIKLDKEAHEHYKKTGRYGDYPPKPPKGVKDFYQCPYCGRRFVDKQFAEQHIGQCPAMEGRDIVIDAATAGTGYGTAVVVAPVVTYDGYGHGPGVLIATRPMVVDDLPPYTSENYKEDLVQCPYCKRKYFANVAMRHIPHCKNDPNRKTIKDDTTANKKVKNGEKRGSKK